MPDIDKLTEVLDKPSPAQTELTEKQKQDILKSWNSRVEEKKDPPSFREMLDEVFGKELDSRSRTARLAKEFLASRELKIKTATPLEPKFLELSPEQIEFITSNQKNMSAIEIAKIIFDNSRLIFSSAETITVAKKIKEIATPENFEDPNDIVTVNYSPPKSLLQVIARIKKYTKREINDESLNPKQKKELWSLIAYLSNYRFTSQIEIYEKQKERERFESNFIRFTYDKSDLTEEEIEQYVLLCTDSETLHNIQQHVKRLEKMLDDATEEEDPKISMGLTEAITSARKEYNECFARQDKLLKNLVVKRSTRLEKEGSRRMNLVELVEFWSSEEKRSLIIKLAEERKKKVKEEINRLSTLDDLKFQVWGIDPSEVLDS